MMTILSLKKNITLREDRLEPSMTATQITIVILMTIICMTSDVEFNENVV